VTTAIPAEALEHGDPRRYRRGCTCKKCKAGANAQNIRNRYLRQTGRGIHRAPDRAANHVLLLRAAGLNDKAIRKQSGVCPDVLYRIMRREGTVHVATEKRILAVPIPRGKAGPTESRAYIPGLGTQRRLRALVAAGWYSAELARRLGKDRENINQLIKGRAGGRVAMFQADQVRALYAELSNETPEQHGLPAYYIGRARKMAADRGWAPPPYWDEDDFDNPDFTPALSDDELGMHQLGALRRAEIAHLISFNLSHAEIAARLGMAEGYVRDIAREINTGQRRIRTPEGSAAKPSMEAAA
jgi:transcriptional regulator with XRE-family HTH domain